MSEICVASRAEFVGLLKGIFVYTVEGGAASSRQGLWLHVLCCVIPPPTVRGCREQSTGVVTLLHLLRWHEQIMYFLTKNLLRSFSPLWTKSLKELGGSVDGLRGSSGFFITCIISHIGVAMWTQTPVLRIIATEYLLDCGYHVFLHLWCGHRIPVCGPTADSQWARPAGMSHPRSRAVWVGTWRFKKAGAKDTGFIERVYSYMAPS